jgi:hypothetical protein
MNSFSVMGYEEAKEKSISIKQIVCSQHCDDNKKRTTIAFIIAKGDKLNATSWAIVVDFQSIEVLFLPVS